MLRNGLSSIKFHLQLPVANLYFLSGWNKKSSFEGGLRGGENPRLTNTNEERTRPLIALVGPLVNRSALDDDVALAHLNAFAVVQDECKSAFRYDCVVKRDGAVESL